MSAEEFIQFDIEIRSFSIKCVIMSVVIRRSATKLVEGGEVFSN